MEIDRTNEDGGAEPQQAIQAVDTQALDMIGEEPFTFDNLIELPEIGNLAQKIVRCLDLRADPLLIVGPHGVGKTRVAKTIANEAHTRLVECAVRSDGTVQRKGTRQLQSLHQLFGEAGDRTMILMANVHRIDPEDLHLEIEETRVFDRFLFIGTSSDNDKAEIRGSRKMEIRLPLRARRRELLRVWLPRCALRLNVHQPHDITKTDLYTLSGQTVGFTVADIQQLIYRACLEAFDGSGALTTELINKARIDVLRGTEKTWKIPSHADRWGTALHESCHGAAAALTKAAMDVDYCTIVPARHSVGHTQSMPSSDETGWTKERLLAEIDVCLAARAGEEIFYGTVWSAGCSGDLTEASQLAHDFVVHYGFSQLGIVSIRQDTGPDLRNAIDAEIHRILVESYARVKNLLALHKNTVIMIALILLGDEEVTGDEIRRICGVTMNDNE